MEHDRASVPEPVIEPAAVQSQSDKHGAAVEAQRSAENRTKGEPAPEDHLPPIEPPRSWTKEAKLRFRSLPREMQAYVGARERERDREVRRRQNEAADARRALAAEREAAARAQQQYEEEARFSARRDRDPSANRQQGLATLARQATEVQELGSAEQARHWKAYADQQDTLFIGRVPAFADPTCRAAMQRIAEDYLSGLGFSREEVVAFYNGTVLRDARIQQTILDAAQYHQVRREAATAAPRHRLPSQHSPKLNHCRIDPKLIERTSMKPQPDRTGIQDSAVSPPRVEHDRPDGLHRAQRERS